MTTIITCKTCGKPMWAGPPDEPQRNCALCQIAAQKAKSAGCPSCDGSGYIRAEYTMPDGRVHRQTEPCGDCRAR